MTRTAMRHVVFALVLTLLTYGRRTGYGQTGGPNGGAAPSTRITLDDATRLALEHNPSLRAQRLGIDQAKANEITAALKPNPVFNTINEDFPIFSPGDLTLQNLRTSQEFTDSVTYLLERGGKRLKRVQVAEDTTDVTIKSVIDAERQLRFQVAQAFINVLLAKSNLDFAQEDLKNFAQVVEINQRRVQAGDLSESDFLKIKLQQLQFQQDLSAAEVALIQGKVSLRQAIGFDAVPADFEVVGELLHSQYSIAQPDLEKEALLTRPDLLAAQSSVKLAGDTVALALANRARDLTVESEYKRSGSVNGVGFGISIELPFHDRNQGEIARSRAAASQAMESVEAARIGVLTDVASGYAAYMAGEKVISLYESGYLNQASQSRDISDYAFQRGAASLLDLLDAERSFRATQLSYRQALAAYMLSVEQINLAVGKKVMK